MNTNITTRLSNQNAIELMLPKRNSHTLGTQLEKNERKKNSPISFARKQKNKRIVRRMRREMKLIQ